MHGHTRPTIATDSLPDVVQALPLAVMMSLTLWMLALACVAAQLHLA